MRMKNIWAACTALVLATGMALAVPLGASATTEECVPQGAWTEVIVEGSPVVDAVYETVVVKAAGWQRYSYKGAWPSNTEAPPFPGNWQANTASDPHGIGVEGAYFQSKGNSGNGDWFYLEAIPEVTEQVLVTPAIPAVEEVVKHHPEVVCPEPNEPVTNVDCVHYANGGTATNLNANGWVVGDTRSAGHAEYVAGGLHVYTDDASSNAKVAWAHALNIPLSEVGQLGVDYTNLSPETFAFGPGLNLYVDITADGEADGTLVYEEVYGQDLWVTNGSAQALKDASLHTGGNGSANHGTIDHYLLTFPDATVTGFAFSLGSGVLADGVIHSTTVGCTNFFFDYEEKPVVVIPPQPDAKVTTSVESTTDCEAGEVTTVTTTTTIEFVYVEETNEWVEGEPVIETDTEVREATEEECPVPVTPEKPVKPVVVPTADVLPRTGSESGALLMFAGALLALGLVGTASRALIRRK